jgi:hypothetical protein
VAQWAVDEVGLDQDDADKLTTQKINGKTAAQNDTGPV